MTKHSCTLLLALTVLCLASHAQAQSPLPTPAQLGSIQRVTPPGTAAHRPRFSPDGSQLVFYGGPDGASDIYTIALDGSALTPLTATEAIERDPAFTRSGHIVYSADLDGDFDVYSVDPAFPADAQRVTNEPGDELEPAPSPIEFTLFSVGDDGCSEVAAEALESYDKLLFTRRYDDRSEIWFRGVGAEIEGEHVGRVSSEGVSCDQPSWSGNGLAIAFRCEDDAGQAVARSDAEYQVSLSAALGTLLALEGQEEAGCAHDWSEVPWLTDDCFRDLPREYAAYPPTTLSEAGVSLASPAYSANQIVLLATPEGGGALHVRPRAEGAWQSLDVAGATAVEAVWSPDGRHIALESGHEGEAAIYLVETDFYLQEVVNLPDYPELIDQPSSRLHDSRFVARPGPEKEMFALYDRVRYADRGVFITADAVLQAFHDEFTRLLQAAEEQAEEDLGALTEALYAHYLDRAAETGGDWDQFLAVYFSVPHALLTAGASMGVEPADYDPYECRWMASESELSEDDQAFFDRACAPVLNPPPLAETVNAAVREAASNLPDSVREPATALLERVLAHADLSEIDLPTGARMPVDFTQFIVRGDYATPDRADYFLAIMWYGQVPLPFDVAVVDLVGLLETLVVGTDAEGAPVSAQAAWQGIDTLIGGFIGDPIQVSVNHVRDLRVEAPELLGPDQLEAAAAWLRERLGPVAFRGLEGALSGEPSPLRFSLFPRRLGLDTTFFSQLTHPAVPTRGLPSALDVWAALGNEPARRHASSAAAGEEWAAAYQSALSEILAERASETLASTDIYASWLAALNALGQATGASEGVALPFTGNDAWRDRLLYSTLAGYAQLKHASVLYGAEDYGVQCGGDYWIYGYVEQPVIPEPRGFVDPAPAFFRAMVTLADRTYAALNDGEIPEAHTYMSDLEGMGSVRGLAERLASLAERELRGESLTEEDYEWMQGIGALLEILFLSYEVDSPGHDGPDVGRSERGVALTVGIYTNAMRGEVLHLGIGRLLDLFVAVPNDVGQRLTQGGLLSVYEFWHPMSDRLTDEAWNARVESGDLPPLPSWSESFIEAP